jgi:hypothetical protein
MQVKQESIVKSVNQEYGYMVNIHTVFGEMRIIFKTDGTFRLITDLKVEQVQDILKAEPQFGEFQAVQQVERFGHPFED